MGISAESAMNPDVVTFGAGLLAGTMNALAGGGTFVTLLIASLITLLFFARAYLKEPPW